MTIQDKIKELSSRWINPVFAEQIPIPRQIDALAVHAFKHRIPDNDDTDLVRECLRRLDATGSLSGD